MELYFIGDEELVTAFRFIGIHGAAVKDADETMAVFNKITEGTQEDFSFKIPDTGSCRILFLTEESADWLGDTLINWQLSGHYPLIVEIPGISGRQEGRKTLVDSIRDAIGIHI